MRDTVINLYQKIVLDNAKNILIFCAIVFLFFLIQIPNFKSDVSSDSFLLQNDPDLLFTQKMAKKYSSGLGGDLLIIAFTPEEFDLFSQKSLNRIKTISDELLEIEGVKQIRSILNMPLLFSPKVSFSSIEEDMRTLEDPNVDISLARREFQTSAFYKNSFVSVDEKTTAILIMIHVDEEGETLRKARDELKIKELEFGLNPAERIQLFKANRAYNEFKSKNNSRVTERIEEVRNVMKTHKSGVRMFLGGASMVVVDALSYIKNDISTFSIGVVLFLVIALAVFFREIRWITIPLLCCITSTLFMVGIMGFLDWRINPISSNFIALLLIISMSIVIHLVVRYRELVFSYPEESQRFLVANATRAMFLPCFYTALTTIVAFCSLILSGIVPVESFGKVMALGIAIALVVCFIIFPSVLMLLKPTRNQYEAKANSILTNLLAVFCEKYSKVVIAVCVLSAIAGVYGFTRLTVENRFIDYFHKDTEIYQGMREIDTKLGGTTPLDIIVDAPKSFFEKSVTDDDTFDEDFDFADDDDELNPMTDSYWFNPRKLQDIVEIHDYLESLPETGQVLSIASTYKTAVRLNNDNQLGALELQLLHSFIPEDLKALMVSPYLADDGNQIRFNIRVIDSQENLERKVLLEKIVNDLTNKFDLDKEQIRPSSFVVLYNNMLQSLFNSQFNTLGFVFLGILTMFVILFRSFKVALIAIIPNIFAAGLIIGVMGLINLPLDLMTTIVAAITIGIGVDDTIHYVHRFREEFKKDGHYIDAMHRSHRSIGMALYYTSLTIIFGFSILGFSNFMPTVHFGMLAGLAMFIALIANLTLLPVLLVGFKPLSKNNTTTN